MKFRKGFKKIVWGFYEVEANNIEEAKKKFDEGEYDAFDNKEEVEDIDEEWTQEVD